MSHLRDLPGPGATHPFLAQDDRGHEWVVKAHENPPHALFQEYVGGNLALWLGLPWPEKVEVAILSKELASSLETTGEYAVAVSYIPDLVPIDYGLENTGYSSNCPFLKLKDPEERLAVVRNALRPLLAGLPGNVEAIYGRVVFDNWLGEKDPMMDMLQLRTATRGLCCLDASTGLNGRDRANGTFRQPHLSDDVDIHAGYMLREGLTLYAKAIVDRWDGFEPWLNRVKLFKEEVWDNLIASMPRPLLPPKSELDDLRDQVCDTTGFLRDFKPRRAPTLRGEPGCGRESQSDIGPWPGET